MASVLFFMLYDIDDLNRNNTKLVQQMEAAKKMGFQVSYLGYSHKGIFLCSENGNDRICNSVRTNRNFFKRMQIFRACLKVLDRNTFDYCYIRKMITTINYGRCLKKMANKNIPVAVEIPTYPDYKEVAQDSRILKRLAFKVLWFVDKHYSKYVSVFALIGEKADSYMGIRAINIDNGIIVDDIAKWEHRKKEGEIHVMVVANFCYWHGYERLINGIREYYKKDIQHEKIIVHMVGEDCDGSLKKWIAMAEEAGIIENIVCEGEKYGAQLDEIANMCDVAIAGLGLYKKKLFNASELKVLNYCARGIPFLYCSEPLDNSCIKDCCMKIPNDASPLDVEEMVWFCRRIEQITDASVLLRDYCKQNYNWESQLGKVFKELGWNG